MAILIPILAFFLITWIFILRDSRASIREAALKASIVWAVIVVCLTECLSLFHRLDFFSLLLSWFAALSVLAFLCIRLGQDKAGIPKRPLPVFTAFEKAVVAAISFVVGIVCLVAILSPPNSWDALAYHMSRVAFWAQNSTAAHYPTPEYRQLFFQPLNEFIILHFQILSGSDRWANMVSFFGYAVSVLGVSVLARQLGASRRGQLLSSFFAATVPVAIIFASSAKNDSLAGLWLVCLTFLILKTKYSYAKHTAVFMGICLGLALLTKGTMYIFCFPFMLWYLSVLVKRYGLLKALGVCGVVAIIALAVNMPFYLRNIQSTGGPLHQAGMDNLVEFSGMTPGAYLCLLARNIAFQLSSKWDWLNGAIIEGVRGLHEFFGIAMDDPRLSAGKRRFYLAVSTMEDNVTNFCQMAVMLICWVGAFASRKLRGNRDLMAFMASTATAFILMCLMIKWSNWSSKLAIPLFVLQGPIIGIVLGRFSGKKRKIFTYLLILILFGTSMPYVFRNHLRRVVIGKKPGIFNASRTELYFRLGSNLREPYQEAADAASAGECRQIGLYMDGNYWDYPFFVFLKDRGGESPRLEHLHLRGLSPTDYPLGPFDPCAVIAVNKARGDRLELEGLPVLYRVYERQIQSPLVQNVSVYRLSGFIE